MNSLRAAIVGIVLAMGIVLVASVQQQRPPVFRGEAVLVTVDAYPHRDGKIVEGLTAAEFEILEDGKPQQVDSVEFVRIEPGLSESARRDPDSVGEMLALTADPRNRVFVVFLDRLHVTVGGSHAIRKPLVDALNRIIGPNDLFAVMTQNTDPRALTFGRRLISVEEQLSKYWDWAERDRYGFDPTDGVMETMLKACFEVVPCTRPPAPWFISDNGQQRFLYELLIDRRREDRTVTSLERLVERLSGMREARTTVLAISEGWRLFSEDRALANQAGKFLNCGPPPLPGVGTAGGRITTSDPAKSGDVGTKDCTSELIRLANLDGDRRLRELTVRANRANVSFYPVNPIGLQTFDTSIKEDRRPSLAEDGARLRNRINGLRTLADATDGIAIVDTNDLAAGMKRIVDDVSAYYLLTYYSTNTTHDGRYRRIEVKTKQPGLHVRARRGYFAPRGRLDRDRPAGAAVAEPPKGLDAALGELARLRRDADLFVRGSLIDSEARVIVEISAARGAAAPWSNGADVEVNLGAGLKPVVGRIEPGARGVAIAGSVASSSIQIARVIVKVTAAGESIEEAVELGRAVPGLTGEPILFRGRPAATSPLRPVADLQYRRTERLHVEWPLTGDIDQRSARLLGRNGQPLAVPVTVTERETDGRRVVAVDLNLAPLSAGDFVIELSVGRGATAEQRLVAFRVIQ